jgi:hypothetical protein
MKWDKPNGSTQHSADKRYVVVQANSQDWIAYRLTGFATGEEVGTRKSEEAARQACEDHARVKP